MRFWLLGLVFLFLPLSIIQDFRENLVVAETISQKITDLEIKVKDVQTKYNTAKTAFIKDGNKQNTKALKIAKGKLEAAQEELKKAREAQKLKQQDAQNPVRTGGQGQSSGLNTQGKDKLGNIKSAGNKLKSLKAEKAYVLADINKTPILPTGTCQICLTSEFKEITTSRGEKLRGLKGLRDEYVKNKKLITGNETLIQRVLYEVKYQQPGRNSLGVPQRQESDDYGDDPAGAWLSPTTKNIAKFFVPVALAIASDDNFIKGLKDRYMYPRGFNANEKLNTLPKVTAEIAKIKVVQANSQAIGLHQRCQDSVVIKALPDCSSEDFREKFGNSHQDYNIEHAACDEKEPGYCNPQELKIFLVKKIAYLKYLKSHYEEIEKSQQKVNKIELMFTNAIKNADKNLKKLIDRQSSQDYRDRLNEISERESKDYGFDTGTILRPHKMSNTTNFSLQRLLQKLLLELVKVIGTFAVLGVMIGALLWLTAQGDENRITQGKEVVIWSCVGVALAYLSNILVNWWMNAVTVVIGG